MNTYRRQRRGSGAGKLLALAGFGAAAYFLYRPLTSWLSEAKENLSQRAQDAVRQYLRKTLGADVHWDGITFSPMQGVYEARGVRVVAVGTDRPVMNVDRARVEVTASRMFVGQMQVDRIILDRPTVWIERGADGRTNLPELARDADNAVRKAEQAAEAAKTATDVADRLGRLGLKMRVDELVARDGELHYRDRSIGDYHVSVQPFTWQMWRQENGYAFVCDAESIARRDAAGQPLGESELGPWRERGELTGTDDLLRFSEMGLRADVQLGRDGHMEMRCERLSGGTWQIHTGGSAELTKLAKLLPEQTPGLDSLRGVQAQGDVDVRIRFEYSEEHGLRVPEATVTARDVGVESSGQA